MDLDKMSVKELAVKSEDNKLMQGSIWTKAYALEAENERLKSAINFCSGSCGAVIDELLKEDR